MEILQNGEASSLYPYCVHEEAVNAVLENQVDNRNGNYISGAIVRTTPDNTDTINIDIFFYNGLGKYNDKGDLVSTSVEVRASYKKINDPDSAYQSLGFFNSNTNTISGAELKTKRYQVTKRGLASGQYTVKIERISSDSSSDTKIIDQVYIGSIRSIKSKRPIRYERQKDLTVIVLRVLATSQLNGVLDSLNFIATSKLPVYNAASGRSGPFEWMTSAETRNPAAMLLYALRGRAAQQIVDDEDIDYLALENFFTWSKEHHYTCDAYIAESFTIAELLRMIGATSRASILRIDSKISVVQDIERTSPIQLFTPKNTKSYSITMFSADIPDAVSLRYIDSESGYAQNECTVYNTPDGNKITEPETTQKVDLWGITNSEQGRRIGMYNYACLKHRPFVHTIEADIEYLLCNKGDWIQYAGDIALAGSTQGRIQELFFSDDRCVGFRTDEPLESAEGKQYAVRIRKPNGTVILKDVAIVNQPNEIYFTEPLVENDIPGVGNIYAFGIRGQEVLDLVITDIQPGQDLSATLICVEYSPVIFNVDDPNFILPEFENKITPVSGAVDSGVINQSNWQLFVTYYDSEEEPAKPTGNGQGWGWHYAQTLRSVWQSSKMAEAIDSGEWGSPVRIKNERTETDVIPIYLTLSPSQKILECDNYGNILPGLLPFTSQAELFMWNSKISLFSNMVWYPGEGENLFDPMLGEAYPENPKLNIEFSLLDAPKGVSINERGLITVAPDAELEDENSITVQAAYEGSVYKAVLFISQDTRAYASRYLGTIDTLPKTAIVTIIKGPVQGEFRARQGDYVLAVASGYAWEAGRVYQWSGLVWEYREPTRYSDLYIRCFADGLEVPSLTQEMGWFGAVFAQMLIAQKAFIQTIEAQLLKITGAIYGGDRFDANGNVVDERKQGWHLGSNGILQAFRGIFNNIVLTASSFEITANNKGYLPVGFIYFQIRGQPTPGELFSGTWENISSQYAGLFFRVEGGNATAFGQNQDMSIQSHSHRFDVPVHSTEGAYGGDRFTSTPTFYLKGADTSYVGGTETRPVNTTIRVWRRIS